MVCRGLGIAQTLCLYLCRLLLTRSGGGRPGCLLSEGGGFAYQKWPDQIFCTTNDPTRFSPFLIFGLGRGDGGVPSLVFNLSKDALGEA